MAEEDAKRIQTAVDGYVALLGRLPATLKATWASDDTEDPFGAPYDYQPGPDGTYELRSPGPDGELDTDDDWRWWRAAKNGPSGVN